MKQTFINFWSKIQPIVSKFYSISPFFFGVVIGYFGHGPLHLASSIVITTVRTLLKF